MHTPENRVDTYKFHTNEQEGRRRIKDVNKVRLGRSCSSSVALFDPVPAGWLAGKSHAASLNQAPCVWRIREQRELMLSLGYKAKQALLLSSFSPPSSSRSRSLSNCCPALCRSHRLNFSTDSRPRAAPRYSSVTTAVHHPGSCEQW